MSNIADPVGILIVQDDEGRYIGYRHRGKVVPFNSFRAESLGKLIDKCRRYYSPGVVEFFYEGEETPFRVTATTKTEKRAYE